MHEVSWLLRVQEMISQVFSNPEPNQDWLKRYQTSIDACARFMQGITVCHEQQNNLSARTHQYHCTTTHGKLWQIAGYRFVSVVYPSICQHTPAYTGVCQGDASDSATSWFICQAYAKVAVMSQASAVWRSGIEQDMYKIVVLI